MAADHGTDDRAGRICEVLSHPMRRALLRTLRGTETTTVETLARKLVDADAYRADGGRVPDESTRVRVALHHHHLPKMAEAGVLEYDPDAGTVETTDTTERAIDLLNRVSTRDVG